MNATVAWSYQLLAPDEQRAFRRFGAEATHIAWRLLWFWII